MGNLIKDALETYGANLKLVLLFSIPFVIAFLIPLIAPLPTYISAGAIFLRSASIFYNLSISGIAVIIASLFFSLLFLSFAFVAISLIVKARRTYMRVPSKALKEIEKHISRVFILLLAYTLVLLAANMIGYYLGFQALLTDITGFFGMLLIFYAPSAIVVGEKRVITAVSDSIRLMAEKPQYFVQWLFLSLLIISAVDLAIIFVAGTPWSMYLVLIVNSLLIAPYFVIFTAEAYMRKFPILRH
jgi:hypothetical protein